MSHSSVLFCFVHISSSVLLPLPSRALVQLVFLWVRRAANFVLLVVKYDYHNALLSSDSNYFRLTS